MQVEKDKVEEELHLALERLREETERVQSAHEQMSRQKAQHQVCACRVRCVRVLSSAACGVVHAGQAVFGEM